MSHAIAEPWMLAAGARPASWPELLDLWRHDVVAAMYAIRRGRNLVYLAEGHAFGTERKLRAVLTLRNAAADRGDTAAQALHQSRATGLMRRIYASEERHRAWVAGGCVVREVAP